MLLKAQFHVLALHCFFFLTHLLLAASLLEKFETMRAATGSEQASSGDKKATCKTIPLLSIPSLPETVLGNGAETLLLLENPLSKVYEHTK